MNKPITGIIPCARCGDGILPTEFSAPVSGGGDGVWDAKCYTYMTGLDQNGNRVAGQVSKDELKAELERREQQEKAAVHQKKNEQADRIMGSLDALLLLVPEHSRTSCSDTNISNAYQARCTRCALLEAERDGFWRNDLDLSISASWDEKHST